MLFLAALRSPWSSPKGPSPNTPGEKVVPAWRGALHITTMHSIGIRQSTLGLAGQNRRRRDS